MTTGPLGTTGSVTADTVDLIFLRDGGEMGALMRAHDWSTSSLGPPTFWSQSLRTAVRLILNTGHPMFVFWGDDHACLYNDACRQSIGPERHPSCLGRHGREVWAEIWEVVGPQIDQVMSGGGATWHVNHLVPITRHGRHEDVYWTYSYSPVDDEGTLSGIGGVLVICSETTEQVLASREASTERDRLAQLFEQSPTFMAVLGGPEHRFEIANPAYIQLVGHRAVLGRTVAEAVPEAVAQGYLALLDGVYQSGTAHLEFGKTYTRPDSPDGSSTERFVDFVYQPIKDREGRVTGIFVQGADVTDRIRAGEALSLIEPRLRGLLKSSPGFMWTADGHGEIDYVSPRLLAFTGRQADQFTFLHWREFIHAPDLPRVTDGWARANVLRTPFQMDVRVRRHDGVWRWFDLRAEPELHADGTIHGWYGYGVDQHERREAEAALLVSEGRFREMVDQLRKAHHAKDDFLAILAHELRNPLAPIRNALELMNMAPDHTQTDVFARAMIGRQLRHMVRLVDDLLDLARMSRDLIELRRTRLPLANVIADAVETSRPVIEQYGHVLTVVLPDEEMVIDGDPTRLMQVFANLLNNAAKFTPVGGQIELRLAQESDAWAAVSVRDTGQGIPPAMLDQIFDMFTRVDRRADPVGGGLGIGLTLVRRLVEMHGGAILAYSGGAGTGSEFVVRLPLAAPRASDATGPAEIPDATPVRLVRRIVVADDNADAAEALGMMLGFLGHQVRTAIDGDQAFDIAQAFQPDAMVLDIGMPGRSGHDLARAVRSEAWGRTVLLIALSGWGQDEHAEQSRDAGFDHHLVKPVSIETLDQLLRARPIEPER